VQHARDAPVSGHLAIVDGCRRTWIGTRT